MRKPVETFNKRFSASPKGTRTSTDLVEFPAMLLVIAMFLLIGGGLAATSNPDTFSPAKFLLLFYFIFHVGAFFDPPSVEVQLLIAIPLVLILILVVVEMVKVQYLPPPALMVSRPAGVRSDITVPLVVWALTLPALFAQLYMIGQFGGIEGYISSVNTRVADWSGFGWARVLIGMTSALNVGFLAIGLLQRRTNLWWTLFVVHLAFVVLIGFMSGSRSGLLNVFALLLVCVHYLRRPIGLGAAGMMVVALIGISSVLGVARNGFKLDDGQITTGFATSGESFSFNSFQYGVEPLDLLVRAPQLQLANGSTFASLVTNAIPRAIYPEKPDTGGVFLTKTYAGNAWEGLSNLTPTFMGEWIINFGWTIGVFGFFISYFLICLGILAWYIRLLRNPDRPRDVTFALDLAIYIHVLWMIVGLMPGELTSVVLGCVLSQIFPLVVLRMVMRTLERSRPPARPGRRPDSNGAVRPAR